MYPTPDSADSNVNNTYIQQTNVFLDGFTVVAMNWHIAGQMVALNDLLCVSVRQLPTRATWKEPTPWDASEREGDPQEHTRMKPNRMTVRPNHVERTRASDDMVHITEKVSLMMQSRDMSTRDIQGHDAAYRSVPGFKLHSFSQSKGGSIGTVLFTRYTLVARS